MEPSVTVQVSSVFPLRTVAPTRRCVPTKSHQCDFFTRNVSVASLHQKWIMASIASSLLCLGSRVPPEGHTRRTSREMIFSSVFALQRRWSVRKGRQEKLDVTQKVIFSHLQVDVWMKQQAPCCFTSVDWFFMYSCGVLG